MKPANAVVVALLVALVVWSPPLASQDVPYSIYNKGPQGTGAWVGYLGDVEVAHGPFGADPDEAILVIAPRLGYTDDEAAAFREFLRGGGRAVVADSTGSARTLLARVPVDITEAGIFSTSYAKNPDWPIAESLDAGLPKTVIMSRPHVVEGAGEVLLASHAFTWKDTNNNGAPDLGEPRGAWPLAMRVTVGQGELVVVGDADLFTQDVSVDAAGALLGWLADNRTVVVDEGHRARSDPVGATAIMSGARPALATAVAVATCLGAALVMLRFRVERKAPKRRPQRALPDDAVLDELPDAS